MSGLRSSGFRDRKPVSGFVQKTKDEYAASLSGQEGYGLDDA
jgi:hypothetical protein